MNKLEVKWTGRYPCLCSGEWIINYDGKKLDIPKEYKNSHMNTFGEYDYLVDLTTEEFETYVDGLDVDDWIEKNKTWITEMFNKESIIVSYELLEELYRKIQRWDWRSGSCGGCI